MTDDENGPDRAAPPTPHPAQAPQPPQTWPVQQPSWDASPTQPDPQAGPPAPAPPAEGAAAAMPQGWQSAPPPPAPPGELPPWGGPAGPPAGPPTGPSTGKTVAVILGVTAAVTVAVVVAVLALWQPWDRGGPSTALNPRPTVPGQGPTDPAPFDPEQTPIPDPSEGFGPAPTEPVLPPQTLKTDAAKEYVKRANAFCRDTTDPALKKAFGAVGSGPGRALAEAARINRDLGTYLRKDVPAELSGNITAITKAWDTLATEYEAAAKAFAAGDPGTFTRRLATGDASNRDGNSRARQIGLSDCADAGGLGGGPKGSPSPRITA